VQKEALSDRGGLGPGVYSGPLDNKGKPHGRGVYTTSRGVVYKGNFKAGFADPTGAFTVTCH
jgi:hypothetical protein